MDKEDRRISIVINGKEMIPPMHARDREREKASQENTFQWVLPETKKMHRPFDFLSTKKKRKPSVVSFIKKKKKKQKHSPFYLNKIWLSAVSAVLIGTSFGMIILMMFTGGNVLTNDASGKGQAVEETAGFAENKVDLSLNLKVVQGGAFKTETSAGTLIDTLKESGFAAVIDNSSQPIFIYIGLAASDEEAKRLSEAYEEKGQDTYVKSLSVFSSGTMAQDEAKWLSEGKRLLTMLVTEAAVLLDGQEHERNEIEAAFENWEKTYAASKRNEKEDAAVFYQHLSEANEALRTYRNDKNENELWKAEQALLEAFLQYKKLIK